MKAADRNIEVVRPYLDKAAAGARSQVEFRCRFLEGRPARWFVYLNAPVSRLAAIIDLGPAVVDVPDQIAAVAAAGFPAAAGWPGPPPLTCAGPGSGLPGAGAPKPGPGRLPGSKNRRPAPSCDAGKAARGELTLKAKREKAG